MQAPFFRYPVYYAVLWFRAFAFASRCKDCASELPSRGRPGKGAFVRGLPSILISLLVPFPGAYFFGAGHAEVIAGGIRVSKLAVFVIVAISVFAIVAYYALVIARRLKCAGFTFYIANRLKTSAFAFTDALIIEFICFIFGECFVYYPVGAGNDNAAIPRFRGCVYEVIARRD